MKIDWDAETRGEIVTAINMHINYLETGTVTHSATDAQTYNSSLSPLIRAGTRRGVQLWAPNPNKPIPIKALSSEQRRLIIKLEDARDQLRSQHP